VIAQIWRGAVRKSDGDGYAHYIEDCRGNCPAGERSGTPRSVALTSARLTMLNFPNLT
jgi:hypothetical protein